MNRLKIRCKSIFSVFIVVLFFQCSSVQNDAYKTIIVAAKTADCNGVAPMKCLQIKEKEDESWQNFYSNIEGFTYEPGSEYM